MKKHINLKAVLFAAAALLLVGCAFGTVDTEAATAAANSTAAPYDAEKILYDGEKDIITVQNGGSSAVTIYYGYIPSSTKAVAKTEFGTLTIAASSEGAIKLGSDTKLSKVNAINKEVTLFITADVPTDGAVTYTANVTVKPNTNKLNGVDFLYNYAYAGNTSEAISATVKDGSTAVTVTGGAILYKFADADPWQVGTTFTGNVLSGKIGAGANVQVALKGTSGNASATNLTRPSAVKKVKIAKAADAKAVKIDYKKGTVAIKNGYDVYFSATQVSGSALEANFIRILPHNKDAATGAAVNYTALSTNATVANVTTNAAAYIPEAKCSADNKAKYTGTKVASVALALPAGSTNYLYVRKSATTKAPAQKYQEMELTGPAAAPAIVSMSATGNLPAVGSGTAVNAEFKEGSKIKLSSALDLEFTVVVGSEYANIDTTSLKWTSVKKDKEIDLVGALSKVSYKLEGQKKASKRPQHSVKDYLILIRTPANTKKGSEAFASVAGQYKLLAQTNDTTCETWYALVDYGITAPAGTF